MFQVHVRSECVNVVNDSAAHGALVGVVLSVDNLQMPASDLETLEGLCAHKTSTTAIRSPDGEFGGIICGIGRRWD